MPSSEADTRHESPGPKVSRKSHRKSRNGCLNCKRRRIKCNEAKPQCDNCVKHSDKCSFRTASQAVTPTQWQSNDLTPHTGSPSMNGASPASFSGTSERVFGQSHVLNIMDLELLHNWSTSAAYTVSNISQLQTYFRVNIPTFAFSYPYVLHGMFALSALHLAHFKRGESQLMYRREAEHHYEIALRTATSLLPTINDSTAPPLYLFGTFCNVITLSLGPKQGDFLLFGDEGLSEWLIIFRGVKAILDTHIDMLMHGELAPLFRISQHHLALQATSDEHLQDLRELINTTAIEDPDLPIYTRALNDLGLSFPATTVPGVRATVPSPQIVFVWLYRLQDEYVQLLYQRKPIPLVILSYFCVLLHDLGSYWWAKNWAEHLISEIHSSLTEEYRIWMRWPMEEIGWLPG